MVDAVLVGVGTVLADDPQLTARPGEVGLPVAGPVHQPLRVVLDSNARTPTIAKVLGGAARTIICTTERAAADRRAALEAKGAEVLVLDEREGRVDVGAALRALGDRGVISVLSEAGGTVAWSLLEAGAVDKVLAFIAPKLVGGREALSPIGGLGLDRMDCAVELATPEWTVLGRDVLLTAYVEPLSQVRQG
jgi:diaminohydroxyphosphoribosylaminopyrimidine deaminase/5-amino-6-(5-phosphoribosylamino)uracil reductase